MQIDGSATVSRDWELLQELSVVGRSDHLPTPTPDTDRLTDIEERLRTAIEAQAPSLADMLTRPRVRSEVLLMPEPTIAPS